MMFIDMLWHGSRVPGAAKDLTSIGAAPRATVAEKHAWDEFVNETESLYRTVLGSSKGIGQIDDHHSSHRATEKV
jgi:hypothetical protein